MPLDDAALQRCDQSRHSKSCHSCFLAGVQLLNNSEAHIAGERAARRGHYDLAGCSAARDDGRHVGVGDDLEAGRCDTVEGDAGCAGKTLTEDLCLAAGITQSLYERHKWS